MAEQQITYEGVVELIRQEFDRRKQEKSARRKRESDREYKKLKKIVGDLGSRVGDIIENMVAGRGKIVDKFNALGYRDIDSCYQNREFGSRRLGTHGQIDLILENGDVVILIEVKTTLETSDVRKHIERLKKYRHWVNAKGKGADTRFVGAVAGAVIKGDAEEFAHENGMYVIVQSGEAVEIVTPPEGFIAKEW
jgi:hypothetical protein